MVRQSAFPLKTARSKLSRFFPALRVWLTASRAPHPRHVLVFVPWVGRNRAEHDPPSLAEPHRANPKTTQPANLLIGSLATPLHRNQATPGPKARSITAWGAVPGNHPPRTQGPKPRSIFHSPPETRGNLPTQCCAPQAHRTANFLRTEPKQPRPRIGQSGQDSRKANTVLPKSHPSPPGKKPLTR